MTRQSSGKASATEMNDLVVPSPVAVGQQASSSTSSNSNSLSFKGINTTDCRHNKVSPVNELNIINDCIHADISGLLIRFFQSVPVLEMSFARFKDVWKHELFMFSVIHQAFDASRVDYYKFLQTIFEDTLRHLWNVSVEVQSLPHLQALTHTHLVAIWNIVVIFTIYCIHGTQRTELRVALRNSQGPYPIRVGLREFALLCKVYNDQLKHLVSTQIGREGYAVIQKLLSARSILYCSYTGIMSAQTLTGREPKRLLEEINEAFSLLTTKDVNYIEARVGAYVPVRKQHKGEGVRQGTSLIPAKLKRLTFSSTTDSRSSTVPKPSNTHRLYPTATLVEDSSNSKMRHATELRTSSESPPKSSEALADELEVSRESLHIALCR